MTGALDGVTVLEFSQIIAGPLCGLLLADFGANVIKVEPLEGEPWRLQNEFLPKESKGFIVYNRGKQDIAIDLRRPEARAVIDGLVRRSDVVLINYRPGVAEQLGIDYETLRAVNPRVIFCEATAFGSRGPDAQKRGYDIIVQAMTGLMTAGGKVSNGLPVLGGPAIADLATGMLMAYAILAALYAREQTGVGQKIEASLLASALLVQGVMTQIELIDAEPHAALLQRLRGARAAGATYDEQLQARMVGRDFTVGNIYYRTYKTADSYLAIGCLGPVPRRRLLDVLGLHDPRLDSDWSGTEAETRVAAQRLVEQAEQLFVSKTTDEWLRYLSGRGIPCGPVRFTEELFDDEQAQANELFVTMEHSRVGAIRQAAPPVKLSATPATVRLPPPALGEHTDAILRFAGLDENAIACLHEQGVVAASG